MAAPQTITRQDVEQKIVALAWKDDAFRKAFLADPKAEFEKTLGRKLPAGLKMTAHAEDENHLYFVIPTKPKEVKGSGELDDADLEKVTGGVDAVTLAAIGVGAVTALLVESVATAINEQNKKEGKEHWAT